MVAGVWVHATAWLLRPHSAIILFYSAAKSPSPPTTEADLGEVNAALKGGSLAASSAHPSRSCIFCCLDGFATPLAGDSIARDSQITPIG